MLTVAYSELPNYDLIVPALLKGGIDGLKEACKLTPGNFGNALDRHQPETETD